MGLFSAALFGFVIAIGRIIYRTASKYRATSKTEPHDQVNMIVINTPTDQATELTTALIRMPSGRDTVDADSVYGDKSRYLKYWTRRVHYANEQLPSAPGNFSRYYQALQGVDAIVLAVDLRVGLSRTALDCVSEHAQQTCRGSSSFRGALTQIGEPPRATS